VVASCKLTRIPRIYTQIGGEKARELAAKRAARRNESAVGATKILDHGITAEEVLELTNKIFAPYTVEFASSMSWFAVWKGGFFVHVQMTEHC
jgi:phenol 2-monooxygenase